MKISAAIIMLAILMPALAMADGAFDKEGFVTIRKGDHLWVFHSCSEELVEFKAKGELASHTTRIGAGPAGLTVKAPDKETILAYLAVKPGFVTRVDGERVWVFRDGCKELEVVAAGGELAEHVTRVGAGPLDCTLEAPDNNTLDDYIAWKPGFVAHVVHGRLWVFHDGSEDLRTFESLGELTQHVTRVGAGPGGMTIKGPDRGTIVDYVTALDGFETFVNAENRLWVFRLGSQALEEFYGRGRPEKHITLVGAGPLGLTIKSSDHETAEAYIRAYARWN
jgi:hypothetical protein